MRITLQRDDMNSSKVNVKKDEPWYILGNHVIKTILVLESTRLFIGILKSTNNLLSWSAPHYTNSLYSQDLIRIFPFLLTLYMATFVIK